MIPKSGSRFSEKIMLKKELEGDDDSKKGHPALVRVVLARFGDNGGIESDPKSVNRRHASSVRQLVRPQSQ
jgi:hypothetical protein